MCVLCCVCVWNMKEKMKIITEKRRKTMRDNNGKSIQMCRHVMQSLSLERFWFEGARGK